MEYLDSCVSTDGIATSPKKATAVQEYPDPKDIRSLRSCLWLASYYRCFVPNFSVVAGLSFALTRKDAE